MNSWFLRLFYILLVVIATAFSSLPLKFGPSIVSSDIFMMFVLLTVLVLVWRKTCFHFSFQTVLISMGASLVFMLYGFFILQLPSPSFAFYNQEFDSLLRLTPTFFLNNIAFLGLFPLLFLLFLQLLKKFHILNPLPLRNKSADALLLKSKYLVFLISLYTIIILAANWYDPRFIKLWSFEVDSGTLSFPLTCVILDVMTEVYGYKHARLAIWCGFLFNAMVLAYGQISLCWMPSNFPHFTAYQHFLNFNFRIILASVLSYFATETISAYILAKLKILLQGRWMALRFLSSITVGYVIDVIVFCVVAFTGLLSVAAFIKIALSSWILMVGIEVLALPFSVFLSTALKRSEGLDIYDEHTDFTLLSLEHQYSKTQNRFLTARIKNDKS